MNKEKLEKLALDNPNDFELGGKLRESLNETEFQEDEINWEDMYLRLSAEFDNFRKRVQKDKQELEIRTKIAMIDPILDIDNDISIAAKHSSDEGIKLIISKLEKFLTSQGIETIQTTNYDADLHEVISVVEFTNKGIIDVASKGYKLGDKVIRYPKVILSK